MLNQSSVRQIPYYAILLYVLVAALFFASGFMLGASDGREERQMLRRTFAVMEGIEPKPQHRQPCLPVLITRPERN